MKSPLAIAAAALLIGQTYAPPPSGTAPGPLIEPPPATGGAGEPAVSGASEPAVSEPAPGPAPGVQGTGQAGAGQAAGQGIGGAGRAGPAATAPSTSAQGQAGEVAPGPEGQGTPAEGQQAGAAMEQPTPQQLEQQQLEALQQGFDGMQQQLQQLSEIAAANAQEAAQLRAEFDALAARGESVAANRQQRISALAGVNRTIEQTDNALAYGAADVQGQLEATRQSLEGVIGNANSFGGGGGERDQAFEALRYVQAAQERVDNGDLFTARQYLIIASGLTGRAIGATDVTTAPEYQPTVGGGAQ